MQNTEVREPTKEIGYLFRRGGLYVLGKQAAENMGHIIAHQNIMGVATAVGSTAGAAGLMTIGLAGAVSGMLAQMDYRHRKANIVENYKDEISGHLNKSKDKLNPDDLDVVAKESKVLGEELKQIKRQRSFGIGTSMLATMASLGAVKVFSFLTAGLFVGGGAGLAILGVAATMAVALATYNTVKKPLHHIADKIFHVDYKTTHDHIMGLKKQQMKGREISEEQVLDVFVAGNKELSTMIERRFGQHFDNLSDEKKKEVAAEVSSVLPLSRIAEGLNHKKIKATELAFLIDQQPSGVSHEEPLHDGKNGMQRFMQKCKEMMVPQKHHEETKDIGGAARHYDAINAQALMGQTPQGGRAHTGAARGAEAEMAHVARYEQSKQDAALANLQK